MSKFRQNQAAFSDIKRRLNYRAPPFEANTGKLNSDGTVHPNPSVGLDAGFVWVRRKGERAETRAYAGKVRTDIADIPVLVAQDNITGELTVFDIRSNEAVLRFGGEWAGSLYAQPSGEAFRTTVNGRNLKPGRAKVWISGTLKVNAEAFWYNNTATSRVLWTPSDANVLDLSGNVPAAVSGVDYQRWVVIALNPSSTAPALVAFNGTAVPITQTLLKTSISSISATAGYTSLVAVKLRTGDSDESDLTDTDWEDLRPWVVDVNYSAITGAAITNSTINSTPIGPSSPSTGVFTTLTGTLITGTGLVINVGTQPQFIRDGNELTVSLTTYSTTVDHGATLTLRRAQNTQASPQTPAVNDYLGSVNASGYIGPAFTAARASIRFRAAEAWAVGAQGTFIQVLTTPIGSATQAVALTIHNDRRLEVSGTTLVSVNDATTNAVTDVLTLTHNTTGTPATGIGVGTLFQAETSTTASTNLASIHATWATVTHASRKGRVTFNVYDTAVREAVVIEASGSAAMIGFLGAAAVVRPTAYTQNYTTTTRTVNAYTTDSESVAYTGIDNAQAGTVYAKLTDLNALRTAYENIRASYDNLLQVVTQLIDDNQAYGLLA